MCPSARRKAYNEMKRRLLSKVRFKYYPLIVKSLTKTLMKLLLMDKIKYTKMNEEMSWVLPWKHIL